MADDWMTEQATSDAAAFSETDWGEPRGRSRDMVLALFWSAVGAMILGIAIIPLGLNAWIQLFGYLMNGVVAVLMLTMSRRNAVVRSAEKGVGPPPWFFRAVQILIACNAIAAVIHAYMIALNYA